MKHLLLLAVLLSLPVAAQQPPLPAAPPPDIAAKSWLLADFQTGTLLASSNPDERMEPASLTKLMTAYLSFAALKRGHLRPDQVVPVSEAAWKTGGSRMFIQPDKPATVDQLLKGMIVQSGNDACIALAEAIAGSEGQFAAMMNREAQRLGMKNTHFVNSTGLPDPQHYSTARDMFLLASALIRDFPEYYPIYAIKEFTYNNITQPNRNRLLWTDPYVDGVKTGHTESAGFCLVSSAKRGERRLLAVVMNAAADRVRFTESQKLLNYGFQFFDTVRVYARGEALGSVKVWKGEQRQVRVGVAQDLLLSLPKGQGEKVEASLATRQPVVAPVASGQQLGTVRLALGGRPLGEYPVVALDAVPQASLLGRAWDSLRLMFQ